jgi:hypothetical protein
MQQRKHSLPRQRKITTDVLHAAALGCVFLALLANEEEHGWLEWTTPFALWGVAFLTYMLGAKNDDGAT